MQRFRSPKWVFLVNTGPVALLLALGYGEFSIIQTLLPPASVAQWQWAGIMTPFTSFLALENEAQKAALRQKQAEILAANASLDTLEEDESKPVETPIDSGALALLVAGGPLAGWYLRRSSALAA